MASWSKVLVLAVLVLGGAAVGRPDVSPGGEPAAVQPVARPEADALPLLAAAPHGDGDSWKDTQGQEYRLGIVNAPEVDECFGAEATAERQRLTAGGFRAEVYSTDGYGRGVAVVTLPDGRNLNVHLAQQGFADDRYLEQFRSEKPDLAEELDLAFAEARAQRRGLWGSCSG